MVQSVTTNKGTIKKTTNYTYATKGSEAYPEAYDPNRLLSYRSQWEGQAYSTAPATLTYDNAGRIIKDVNGNLLHYDAFGQQDKFTNAETKEVTAYTYDSKGHQIAKQPFSARGRVLQSPLYMFYSGNTMTAKAQRDKNNRLHVSAELAGAAHSEDGMITRWYLQNYKGDVLQSYNAQGQSLSNNVYSPYGMQYDRQNNTLTGIPGALKQQLPWWQSHLPGFDGQVTDEATGYQFLGGGYRAYNPVYRQFMAKDSFSPFKKVNGYGFGDNNPIMNTDPTGHLPKWLGYAMGAGGIGMSIVMAVLLPVAGAAIAGVSGGATVAGIVGSVAGGVVGTASGSLQIAATKHPENRMLQKVSNGFGIAEGIAGIAMGGAAIGEGIKSIFNTAGTIARLTSASLIASGVSASAAAATGVAASGISEAMVFDSRLAAKSGLQSAVQYLGYISMGLMATSMISGMASAAGMSLSKGENKPQAVSQRRSKVRPVRPKRAISGERVYRSGNYKRVLSGRVSRWQGQLRYEDYVLEGGNWRLTGQGQINPRRTLGEMLENIAEKTDMGQMNYAMSSTFRDITGVVPEGRVPTEIMNAAWMWGEHATLSKAGREGFAGLGPAEFLVNLINNSASSF